VSISFIHFLQLLWDSLSHPPQYATIYTFGKVLFRFFIIRLWSYLLSVSCLGLGRSRPSSHYKRGVHSPGSSAKNRQCGRTLKCSSYLILISGTQAHHKLTSRRRRFPFELGNIHHLFASRSMIYPSRIA